MIKCDELTYTRGNIKILDSISFDLKGGELLGIIGENGAGKSTLARLITGMEKAKNAKITLFDKKYEEYTSKEFAKQICFFPQGRPIPDMNVRTFVSYGKYPHLSFGRPVPKDIDEEISSALKEADAYTFKDKNLRELSYGERQKVYLALMIMQNSNFLILDEPTNFLDPKSKFSLMKKLSEMASSGKGIAVVLHDVSLALNFCNRIILMSKGKIEANGSPAQLIESKAIEDVFGVRCTYINGEYIISQKA